MTIESNATNLVFNPFPHSLRASSQGEGRAAFTVFESFAKEETVVLVEAQPEWGGEDVPDVVFDVVAAYTQDPDAANPATSLTTVRVPQGTTRRFLVGIPGGHKLVLYPETPGFAPGEDGGGRLVVTVVDYWA
ncbi:MAG TPA: hypothetical protein VK858_03675 [Longimicrobiales bacterium]|nr:hypothetical protein [Longimicrobiales bacterium]